MIRTTNNSTYTIIPRFARIQASEILEREGIPYEIVRAEDTPDGVSAFCVFKGKEYSFEKARAIKAAIEPEDLIAILEKEVRNLRP
jgi:hypothetical protein